MIKSTKQSRQYTVPASISKAELRDVAPFYGASNAGQFNGHPPETLRLVTFAGRYDPGARLFVGEYRFKSTSGQADQTFATLPGIRQDGQAKPRGRKAVELPPVQAAPEPDEVTHG